MLCSHVLVFPTALICAKPPPIHEVDNGKVVGGQNAASKTWKWQVIISRSNYWFYFQNQELWPPVGLFPHVQISLQLDSYGEGFFGHICGGSIFNAYHIMTAAHCILRSDHLWALTPPPCRTWPRRVCVSPVISSDPRQYRVVAGEYNLDEYEGSEQFLPVERIIVHPGWTGDLGKG